MRPATLALSSALLCTGLAQAGSLVTFDPSSVLFSVSADGSIAAGNTGGQDFIWTAGGGVTLIGGVAPGTAGTGGRVIVSADGSRVAGQVLDPGTGHFESAYYTPATGNWTSLQGIGGLSNPGSTSATWGMSSSGRYVAGSVYTAGTSPTTNAAIWDTATGTAANNLAPGTTESRINAISSNGRVAVGYVTSGRQGTIWTDPEGDGSFVQTAIKLNGANVNEAISVSDNGTWVVGSSFNTSLPYLYNTLTGVIQTIPKLPFADSRGRSTVTPSAVSEDGQMVIGTHSVGGTLDTNHGFIWTASGGVLDIDTYFASFGIDTGNHFNFVSPLGMSADGSTIVGIALDNSTGASRGFLVNITSAVPEPGTWALYGAGLGAVALLRRRQRPAA